MKSAIDMLNSRWNPYRKRAGARPTLDAMADKTQSENTATRFKALGWDTQTVDGHDIVRDFRAARSLIGLVPQELHTDAFESVWATVSFSRGLFGKPKNPAVIERILKDLSLWDKKDSKIMTLSGGMKRRVMIAKALAHEPQVLFLDEPTAGVDVELRQDMWNVVRRLRDSGVTIILTTHYIDEAEEMADRIGVIQKGEIILVEEKHELMRKLGRKQLTLHLHQPLGALPPALAGIPASSAIQRSTWFSATIAPVASSHDIPCSEAHETTVSNNNEALVGAPGMNERKRGLSVLSTVGAS